MLGDLSYLPAFLGGLFDDYYRVRCFIVNSLDLILDDYNSDFLRNLIESKLESEKSLAVKEDIINKLSELFR
jgi:hypothetical protein